MAKFVNIDRESPLLLPYDLKDWIPGNHIVHFILEAVEMVSLNSFRINHKGSGSAQYPPHMMLAQELGHLKKVGGISIDGTKIKASASKHS